jgi:hypothetical protein
MEKTPANPRNPRNIEDKLGIFSKYCGSGLGGKPFIHGDVFNWILEGNRQ